MLKNIKNIKTLIISVAAISLAACSTGTEVNNTEATNPQTSPTTETQVSPTTTVTLTTADVNFKKAAEGQVTGFMDVVNSSTELKQSITPGTPIDVSGWAVLSDLSKPADLVIITTGADNAIVTTTPVNIPRPDVADSLKSTNVTNSGWATQIDPTKLSGDTVVLQAWAYNATTKEAYPLVNTYEITVK